MVYSHNLLLSKGSSIREVTELKIQTINNVYFSSVDEYNPYCSKWGYCISYNLFGEEGPDQSKGAVQDGTRGQCRDDKDCTPWAPSCSPLGYCRYLLYIRVSKVVAHHKKLLTQ